ETRQGLLPPGPQHGPLSVACACAREPACEWLRLVDHRDDVASALLAGALRHLLPVLAASSALVALQAYDGALGQHRRYAPHSELRRLLHHEVHPLATRYALDQVYVQRRLGVAFATSTDRQANGAPRDLADHRRTFAAHAVEQGQLVPGAQAQDPAGIARPFVVELKLTAGRQPILYIQAMCGQDRQGSPSFRLMMANPDRAGPGRGVSKRKAALFSSYIGTANPASRR